MSIKVGINGFGRIARICIRTMAKSYEDEVDVVAVNQRNADHESLPPCPMFTGIISFPCRNIKRFEPSTRSQRANEIIHMHRDAAVAQVVVNQVAVDA